MGAFLVTLMTLLLVSCNNGQLRTNICHPGCSCVSSSINCCESEEYFQIPVIAFDNITKISFSSCPRFIISKQSIWNLKSLEEIALRRTAVSYIDAQAFGDLPMLKNLILNELNLSLSNLHPLAFNDLPIQLLDLKGNFLHLIPSQMFQGLKNLRILDLSKNNIATIQDLAFETIPVLTVLNLDSNSLISITPLWFKSFSNCSTSLWISVMGNNLTNECSFRGIELTENQRFMKSLLPNDSLAASMNHVPRCTVPSFRETFQEIYVKEDSSITLPCSATGIPRPVLTWLLPTGLEVNLATSTFSIRNGKLIIATIKPGDSGIYACVAKNSEGSSVSLVKVSVLSNALMSLIPTLMVTVTPKKKASFVLLIIFILLLLSVLFFVLGYVSRLVYKVAKKQNSDDFEFSRFVDTPNILPVPENPQPMPHV
ncbi:leucine-rich repeat and fibronectin type III domain-containing protein 1-like protein [Ranitomeya imitator]|uniref:leucine-rich repeat and fibronectin type III domain-containing protein 1-like protein n=1 Tax=Ranitomeya imitator TaxID=111125 RepID=UPI0037E8F646